MQENAIRDALRGDFLLAGVRVIDAASFIAGAVATTIMADLGADVIKIEPPDGDPYRHRSEAICCVGALGRTVAPRATLPVVMRDERAPSRAELLEALRASRDQVLAIVRALPPERLEEGRYEAGWNGRQILAHIASIEGTYPRLIDIAREAPAAEAAPGTAEPEGGLPTRAMRGGNDAYNERQVAKRASLTVAELLAEFERNRAGTIRAVEAVDEALLARPIRSAGGVVGPLATVLYQVAVMHVLGHARDIAGPSSR